MFEIQSPETQQVQERVVSTLEQMQVPNGTGPGIQGIVGVKIMSFTFTVWNTMES